MYYLISCSLPPSLEQRILFTSSYGVHNLYFNFNSIVFFFLNFKIVAESQKTIDQRHLIIAINSHDQNSIDIVSTSKNHVRKYSIYIIQSKIKFISSHAIIECISRLWFYYFHN